AWVAATWSTGAATKDWPSLDTMMAPGAGTGTGAGLWPTRLLFARAKTSENIVVVILSDPRPNHRHPGDGPGRGRAFRPTKLAAARKESRACSRAGPRSERVGAPRRISPVAAAHTSAAFP